MARRATTNGSGARRDATARPGAGAALVAALLLLGCGGSGERAVTAEVRVHARGDRLCLLAWGGGELLFERGYGEPPEQPPPAEGTLTFVAGSRVRDRVRLTARLSRGGRVLATASGESGFGPPGERQLPLDVGRCDPREDPAGPLSPRTLAAELPADATALEAADADGDGREELLVLVDTAGVWLDAEPSAGASAADAAVSGSVATAADVRGGCELELLTVEAGSLRSQPAGAATESPRTLLEGSVRAAAVGDVRGDGRVDVVAAGDDGLRIVDPEGDIRAELDAGAWSAVLAADLTGDGIDDVVASGGGVTRVWIGAMGGPSATAGALPAALEGTSGPLAAGDVDADGAVDLVVARGMGARLLHNRGDGLLEDRSGDEPPTAGAEIARLVFADLDGDCRDDLAVLDAAGEVAAWRSVDPLALEPRALAAGPARDVVAADVDGDGHAELAVLTQAGELEVWTP